MTSPAAKCAPSRVAAVCQRTVTVEVEGAERVAVIATAPTPSATVGCSGASETVGRDTGSIFAGDSYLSPRHATFTRRGDRLFISDARSLNGVYLKIRPNTPWPLRFGDIFRIGQEILRLEKLEAPAGTTMNS